MGEEELKEKEDFVELEKKIKEEQEKEAQQEKHEKKLQQQKMAFARRKLTKMRELAQIKMDMTKNDEFKTEKANKQLDESVHETAKLAADAIDKELKAEELDEQEEKMRQKESVEEMDRKI